MATAIHLPTSQLKDSSQPKAPPSAPQETTHTPDKVNSPAPRDRAHSIPKAHQSAFQGPAQDSTTTPNNHHSMPKAHQSAFQDLAQDSITLINLPSIPKDLPLMSEAMISTVAINSQALR